VTKAAAAEIQTGKVTNMSYPLVDGVPLFGSRFTKTILTATSLAPGASFGENQLTYMEDTWLTRATWVRTLTAWATSGSRTAITTRPRWASSSTRTT
jgi:hypothetical protein